MPKVGDRFNPHRVFVGSFIPNALMKNKEITATAKLCYGRLCQYAGERGECWPDWRILADEIGVGKRQIIRVLNELEGKKFLTRIRPTKKERFNGIRNQYIFNWHETFEEGSPQVTRMSLGSGDTDVTSPGDMGVTLTSKDKRIIKARESGEQGLFPSKVFFECEYFIIEQPYYEELKKEYPLIDFEKMFKKLKDTVFDEPKKYARDGRGKLKSLRRTVRNWCEREIIWGEKNNGKATGSNDPVDKRFESAFGDFKKTETGTAQKNP
jgi:hypothetical protein